MDFNDGIDCIVHNIMRMPIYFCNVKSKIIIINKYILDVNSSLDDMILGYLYILRTECD